MDTQALRKGFGTAAGKQAQLASYHRACNEAANEIDRLQCTINIRSAPALTDVLERMRDRADNAYCDCLGQLRRDLCLGWEIKVELGKFGEAELKAHCAAAEKLGRHRALHEAANMLDDVLRSNVLVQASGDDSSLASP